MESRPRRIPEQAVVGLQLLLAGAAPLMAAVLIPLSTWWALAAVTVAAGGFLLAEHRKRRETAALRRVEALEASARVESRIAITATLHPMVDALTEIITSGRRERAVRVGELTQAAVVAAATTVADPTKVRAGWFVVEVGRDGRRVLRPQPALRYSDGRTDVQRSEFTEGTVEGDAVLRLVDQDAHRYCADTGAEAPPGWDPEQQRDYRCFISVGVSVRGRGHGMLSVDALRPGDLTVEDARTVVLIAAVLRTALAADP